MNRSALSVCLLLALAGSAAAQGQWYPTDGISGPDPAVYSLTQWDPDGQGPLASVTVLAGSFDHAGGIPASNIAIWDGAGWSALGPGLTGSWVDSLAVLSDGSLVASGLFSSAGNTPVANIARWDGANWTDLGGGMNNEVTSVSVLPDGRLVAGGFFTTAGGIGANRIAVWNGGAWSAMGTGMDNIVWSVLALPDGQVLAGGQFFLAGGVHVNNIARWDGTWHAFGGANAAVLSLGLLPNGDVMAGGLFTLIGNAAATRIARFDGSWHNLGSGMNGPVWAFAGLPGGDLAAAGTFTFAGGKPASRIARWNGSAWSTFGPGADGAVLALSLRADGDLLVGGAFTTAGGMFSPGLAGFGGQGCPADPTGFAASESSKGMASLTWIDNAVSETGYYVKREQYLQGAWKNATVVAVLPADATAFSQSPGQGFWRYQVQAFNGACQSAWTPATPVAPAAPDGFGVINAGGSAQAAWADSSNFENRYILQRQQRVGNKWTNLTSVASLARNSTSYTDSPGAAWRCRLRATGPAGSSSFTPWMSVTLP